MEATTKRINRRRLGYLVSVMTYLSDCCDSRKESQEGYHSDEEIENNLGRVERVVI